VTACDDGLDAASVDIPLRRSPASLPSKRLPRSRRGASRMRGRGWR